MPQYFIRFGVRISGPYTADALRRMAESGQFTDKHLISTNRQDWASISQVENLFVESAPPPMAMDPGDATDGENQQTGFADPSEIAEPETRYRSPISILLPIFFILSLLPWTLAVLSFLMPFLPFAFRSVVVLFVLIMPVSVSVYLIFWLIAIYRYWKFLREAYYSDDMPTPGEAVGFFFIPVFNLYWSFIAIAKMGHKLSDNLPLRHPTNGRATSTAAGFMGIILSLQWIVTNITVAANIYFHILTQEVNLNTLVLLPPALLPTSYLFLRSVDNAVKRLHAR
jgi:hypothetical protein